MGLEPDESVDDVGAGLLELAGPDDVRLLVEAGLDLDEDDDLLALLGGPDEVADDGGVAARPVERLLDGQDLGVVGRLGDEPLDGRREALVRVVDEDVAGPDRAEHVGRLVVVRRQEPGRDDRRPGRGLEVGSIELGDRPQAGQVEHAADVVAVILGQADAAKEDEAGRGRHRALDLEADRLAEAASSELLLDRHDEVVGLVLLDGEVGVAGDPEQVRLEDLHAAEQEVEVRLDDLVEEHVRVGLDLHEAGQDLGDLDPGEATLVGLRVAHADGDREAQRADVGERMARIDGQRGEDREDLVDEPLAQPGVMVRQRGVVDDGDTLVGELLAEAGEDRRMLVDEGLDAGPDLGQLFGGGPPVRRDRGRSGGDLLTEAGDPDLEELVEVAGEDGQELRPLEEWVALVARLVEDAGVEVEPGDLAVEVGRRRLGSGSPARPDRPGRASGDTRAKCGHPAVDSIGRPGRSIRASDRSTAPR